MSLETIINSIKQDEENQEFTLKGWEPILKVHEDAKILIIGQAPGIKTQEKQKPFYDKSGERLMVWMQLSRKQFYELNDVAVLPLDFYFPGKGKTGDKPPRKHIASKWHPQLLACMPHIQLIVLAGAHAQKEYLKNSMKKNLTETIRNYQSYLPTYFPIIHPSPLNARWMAKNPFFKEDVLVAFQQIISSIINQP